MVVVMSNAPKSIETGVCTFCGSTIDANLEASLAPERTDHEGRVVSSDVDDCPFCGSELPDDLVTLLRADEALACGSAATTRDTPSQLAAPSLIVVENRKEVPLPAISRVYLGRRDEGQNIHPHIDFTDDGAALRGVSRRHARIHQGKGGIFIEDMNSTNGTLVNGQRLTPSTLYPLDHGDMVHLGQLKLAVSFL